jgi:hypothetical protein
VLATATIAAVLAPGLVAPHGLWPPTRHPGDLAFTAWGLAATLALWALVRRALPVAGRLGAGVARAGRRTLLVFGGHYLIKLTLQHTGHLHQLDTARWEIATWALVLGVALLTTIPPWRPSAPVVSSRDGTTQGDTVPVVRPSDRGPARTGPSTRVLQGELPPS